MPRKAARAGRGTKMALLAGTGRVDITPPSGTLIAGYFNERRSKGVLHPLYVRALVLDDAKGPPVAIVSCDLIGVEADTVQKARAWIDRLCSDVRGENTIICSTHTHTGPFTLHIFGGERDEEYVAWLARAIAGAVVEAEGNLRPVTVRAAKGVEEGISFNRRYVMRDGREATNPGWLNPDIVEPAGPVDHEVLVMRFDEARTGRPLAMIVNHGLHVDVVGGELISADWPGEVERAVRAIYGDKGISVLVLNGCFGNINHINVKSREQMERYRTGRRIEEMERIGRALAGIAVSAIEGAEPTDEVDVSFVKGVVEARIREITQEEVERAQALLRSGEGDLKERTYAKETLLLSLVSGEAEPLEVCALRLGETAMVFLPGEVFCEFGLEIKEGSPFPLTFVVANAGGYVGYIPTERAFRGGGYEPRTARSSRLQPDTGRKLVEEALGLLSKLRAKA